MSINEVRYLPECGSTNAYVKEHFEEFGPVGAVYTDCLLYTSPSPRD